MQSENYELLKSGLNCFGIDNIDGKIRKLSEYADILLETNQKFNLLGNVDERDIVIKHILDSVSGAMYLKDSKNILDIGTGAGFPGMPLAICCEDKKFTLTDATEKKINFIIDTAKQLGVNNVIPTVGRAEELSHGKMREKYVPVYQELLLSL